MLVVAMDDRRNVRSNYHARFSTEETRPNPEKMPTLLASPGAERYTKPDPLRTLLPMQPQARSRRRRREMNCGFIPAPGN